MPIEITEKELEELEKKEEAIETKADRLVEDIEEKYQTRGATGYCTFLRNKALEAKKLGIDSPFLRMYVEKFGDPEDPKSYERCVRLFRIDYGVNFDKWDDNYVPGRIAKLEANLARLKSI